MEKRKREMKLNIPMCAACILLCLTLISIHMTGGLYAKYTSDAQGSDSARVAKFGELTISETGDFAADGSKETLIVPGKDLTKKAVINFPASEVGTYVFVEMDLSDNWERHEATSEEPFDTFKISSGETAYLQWQVASGWKYLNGSNYVYYRKLAPNEALNDADIVGNDGMITVSSKIPTIPNDTMTSLDQTYIKFKARVVQAGDFDSAADAWDSLKEKDK